MVRVAVLIGCGATKRRLWEWPVPVETALHEAREDVIWRTITDAGERTRFSDAFAERVARGYPQFRAANLYASTYFALKNEYRQTFASRHSSGILSAEHGFLRPGQRIEPYNTHIDDVDADQWACEAIDAMDDATTSIREADRIEVLAGRDYVDALRPYLAVTSAEVVYPFQDPNHDLGGVGDQMGWLRSEIDAALPETVEAWTFHSEPAYRDSDGDAMFNGWTWTNRSESAAISVFDHANDPYVAVHDLRDDVRCQGHRIDGADGDADLTRKEAFAAAVDWMADHPHGGWSCPNAAATLLRAPPGFEVAAYYPDGRGEEIRYDVDESAIVGDLDVANGHLRIIVEGYRTVGNYEVTVVRGREREADAIEIPDDATPSVVRRRVEDLAEQLVDAATDAAPGPAVEGQAALDDYTAATDGGE